MEAWTLARGVCSPTHMGGGGGCGGAGAACDAAAPPRPWRRSASECRSGRSAALCSARSAASVAEAADWRPLRPWPLGGARPSTSRRLLDLDGGGGGDGAAPLTEARSICAARAASAVMKDSSTCSSISSSRKSTRGKTWGIYQSATMYIVACHKSKVAAWACGVAAWAHAAADLDAWGGMRAAARAGVPAPPPAYHAQRA
eukprot:scaffold133349_cov90-Phaeocystis_antarctica.AAC.4